MDGLYAGTGGIGPGQIFNIPVLGRGGVPLSGVSAVALNVTVTQPTQSGYLTVFPKGQSVPNASNLNFVGGQTIPNMVIAKVGSDGSVSVFNPAGAVHVVVDISGWFTEGGSFTSLSPSRVADTRPGQATADGLFSGAGAIGPGQTYNVQVLGRGGVPLGGVSAVALNVTVTQPTQSGHLTVFPKGQPVPNASNLNFVGGQTIPNMVIAKVGVDGSISIYNPGGFSHAIIDIAGWFSAPVL